MEQQVFNVHRHTLFTPLYAPMGPLDPVIFKEAALFTCIRVH